MFGGGIAVKFLAGSYTDCPTVTSTCTLLTPLHPWLPTFPHSKQPFPPLEDTNTPWPSAHHTHTCSGQQTTPAGVVGGPVQCDSEVEWGPGTAYQEDTNTQLCVLPRHPLEVLLTSLWCRAESSEQSVVPHLTCTTTPSCRVHCWCVRTVAHSGGQCSPACVHSSHWSHQHSMPATRRAATRLRLG